MNFDAAKAKNTLVRLFNSYSSISYPEAANDLVVTLDSCKDLKLDPKLSKLYCDVMEDIKSNSPVQPDVKTFRLMRDLIDFLSTSTSDQAADAAAALRDGAMRAGILNKEWITKALRVLDSIAKGSTK